MQAYEKFDPDLEEFFQKGSKFYKKDGLIIIVSPPQSSLGWHMSISRSDRNPTWEEIKDAWYTLVPDASKRNGAMFFPPLDDYVNLHTHCFHVHEVSLDAKIYPDHKM